MTPTQIMILKDARSIWTRDGKPRGWAIRDCITLAVDGLRQEADDENRYDAEIAQRERDLHDMAIANSEAGFYGQGV